MNALFKNPELIEYLMKTHPDKLSQLVQDESYISTGVVLKEMFSNGVLSTMRLGRDNVVHVN
jgi:hypothetical protein